MKSAWIITQGGPRHSFGVIGILSSRKSAKDIKARLEWFYALLHCSPGTHFNFARYTNPEVPCEAKIWNQYMVSCEYMIARLGRNIFLIEKELFLKWQNPDCPIFDQQTPPNIVQKIPGSICEAPIHLPLRTVSEDTARKVAVTDTEALKRASEPFDLENFDLEQTVLGAIKLREEMKTIEHAPVEEPSVASEPKSTV